MTLTLIVTFVIVMKKLKSELREAEDDPDKHSALGGKIAQLERIKDVKNHFYSSGFEAWPSENPDLKIYELAKSIVGARWVRSCSLIHWLLKFTDKFCRQLILALEM